MIRNQEITRDKALEITALPPLESQNINQYVNFFKKKLQLSNDEFVKIMSEKPKRHSDYDIDIYNNWVFQLIKKTVKKTIMINALIIGCGRIFSKHYNSLKKIGENKIKIVGVCDLKDKKNEINKKYGLKFFFNYKKAILKTNPDVAIILTPSGLHAEHISFCLKKIVM